MKTFKKDDVVAVITAPTLLGRSVKTGTVVQTGRTLTVRLDRHGGSFVNTLQVDAADILPVENGVLTIPSGTYREILIDRALEELRCDGVHLTSQFASTERIARLYLPETIDGACGIGGTFDHVRPPVSVRRSYIAFAPILADKAPKSVGDNIRVIHADSDVRALRLLPSGCKALVTDSATITNPKLTLFRNKLALVAAGHKRYATL